MSQLLTLVSPSGLVDLALKSAAVMLLAVAAAALLGRASAASRHLVWCLSAASLLLLPALALALPAWRVTWLPQWAAAPTQLAATESGPGSFLPSPPRGRGGGGGGQTSPASQWEHRTPPSGDVSSAAASPASAAAAVEPIMPTGGPFPWLAIGWGAGMLLSLVPLAAGLWQLAALHRRSRVIDDQRWLALLGELRRQLALRRSVQLRQCGEALVPITWGALKPVLLVPAEASAWPDERRRLVLLHELAHVRRWDWLTQLAVHVACATYWFNPLVWLAARQMRIERERACDDLVLASGARASDYAQELLSLAAGLSSSQVSALVAVPMARRGALEDRLRGILDIHRRRAALTRRAVCLGAALTAAAISPLAMLRAALPESAESAIEEPKKAPPAKEQPAVEKPVENPAEKNGGAPAPRSVTIRGKVVDVDTGEPIKQFTIRQAGTYDPLNPSKSNWVPKEDGPSGSDGSFSTTVTWTEGWTVRVRAAGYFPQALLKSAPPADKDEMEMTIRLESVPEKVRGVVRDHAGNPVRGAAVFAVGPIGLNLAAGQALSEAWPGENRKDDAVRPVLTDEKGRFELATGGAPTLAVSHASFDAWTATIPASGGMTVRLPEPARVEVELAIDGAGKESAIFYQLLPELDEVVRSTRTLTIANPGKLVLDALPPGKYQLCRFASTGAMLERQLFALKAGERKTIEYIRNKGARVRGKLTWPADATGMVIRVLGESNATVASTSPAEDGTYLTERIAPGTYGLVAYAYKPLTPEQMKMSGLIAPSYQAQMTIDVPADGEVTVKDLALEPIKRGK